ncbi:MAG: hypothetical protein H6757_01100 [Candidatus Omnitrophica bacterium]|nr:hypothetical protein [Candidatus Omnitrophota bacterium]
MYTCNICAGEFAYLIFEYNTIVCEKCSIHKNISNCQDLDTVPVTLIEPETNFEVQERDAKQLFEIIEQIENPQIREDFRDLAQQYFEGNLEE